MTTLPIIKRNVDAEGPFVSLDGAPVRTVPDLLAAAPFLAERGDAMGIAVLANHLAHGYSFTVIDDPKAFEDAYRGQMAQENPRQAVPPGEARLIDIGMPDFAQIAAPRLEGGQVVFFAKAGHSGAPYRAAVPLAGGEASYDLMDLAAAY